VSELRIERTRGDFIESVPFVSVAAAKAAGVLRFYD